MNITTTLAWLITAHFIQGLIGELHYARPPQKALLHCNDPITVIQSKTEEKELTRRGNEKHDMANYIH